MKKTIILLSALTLVSCETKIKSVYVDENINRNFILTKTDDNNWTTSAIIYCDSVNMESETKAVYYIDGRKSNLYGKLIKIYSNEK